MNTSTKLAIPLLFSLGAVAPTPAAAQAPSQPLAQPDEPAVKPETAKPGAREAAEAAVEKTVATSHSLKLGGHTLNYRASAGTLVIRDDKGRPDASIFYVAYTAGPDKEKELASRPLTFLYNGGPGSSSIWLHMGSFGPVRVATSSPEATPPAPYRLEPNPDCLLDKSDLVFVDAVGTGYSKGLEKGKGDKDREDNPSKRFWGTDQDIDAFARFIARYVTVNRRWNSPKFLFGESYGTPRSAGLARHLEEHGIALNGVVLLSSILNYGSRLPGLDQDYIGLLPSYAATAWYHRKLPERPAALEPFLTEVRAFARGDYAVALAKGQDLPASERDAIAERLSRYTGLGAAYLKQANLRVSAPRFRKELLRGERRTVGRYDARFEGIDVDAAGETPETDPADTAIRGAFVAAFNDYLVRELGYTSEVPYNVSASVSGEWDWKHAARGQRRPLPLPIMISDLSDAMRANPHLKVLSANGYFDLATPFFATEYDLAHLDIDATLRGNLTFTYYLSGHMVYLNAEAARQFKQDLARFYDSSGGR
jgi:carboxypeptidase C (cathepsin A)